VLICLLGLPLSQARLGEQPVQAQYPYGQVPYGYGPYATPYGPQPQYASPYQPAYAPVYGQSPTPQQAAPVPAAAVEQPVSPHTPIQDFIRSLTEGKKHGGEAKEAAATPAQQPKALPAAKKPVLALPKVTGFDMDGFLKGAQRLFGAKANGTKANGTGLLFTDVASLGQKLKDIAEGRVTAPAKPAAAAAAGSKFDVGALVNLVSSSVKSESTEQQRARRAERHRKRAEAGASFVRNTVQFTKSIIEGVNTIKNSTNPNKTMEILVKKALNSDKGKMIERIAIPVMSNFAMGSVTPAERAIGTAGIVFGLAMGDAFNQTKKEQAA